MKLKDSATVYFALQGFGVIGWWLMLAFLPPTRIWFQLEQNSDKSLIAFWLADLLWLAGGSLAAAYLCFVESKHAPIAL